MRTGLFDPFLIVDGDLVLVAGSADRRSGPERSSQTTVAIEVATGEVRWRIPGYVEVLDDVLIAYIYLDSTETLHEGQTDLVAEIYSQQSDASTACFHTSPDLDHTAIFTQVKSFTFYIDFSSNWIFVEKIITCQS